MGVVGILGGLFKAVLALSIIGGALFGGIAATNPDLAATIENRVVGSLGGESAVTSDSTTPTATPTVTTATGTPTPSESTDKSSSPGASPTPTPEEPVLTAPPTATPTPTPTPTPVGDAPRVDVGVQESWDGRTDPDDPGQSSYVTDDERITSLTVEYYIHVKVNAERTKRGLPPLNASGYITSVSRAHSEDMAAREYFAHENPDGESPSDRFGLFPDACGAAYGENVAANHIDYPVRQNGGREGYTTNEGIAQALVNQWMNSTAHRKAILTERLEYVGTGVYIQDKGDRARIYATQNFCAMHD